MTSAELAPILILKQVLVLLEPVDIPYVPVGLMDIEGLECCQLLDRFVLWLSLASVDLSGLLATQC